MVTITCSPATADEGDVDMYKLARVFRDLRYPFMLMPDHTPDHPDDLSQPGISIRVNQAWAFQFGYITALIQVFLDGGFAGLLALLVLLSFYK